MKLRPAAVVLLLSAALGFSFAAVSTYDFVAHLDRQVHDLHCSFVPGLDGAGGGESGCQVTMLSPYSSVMRGAVWGGIPISLPAMATFAFLLLAALDLSLTRRGEDRRAVGAVVVVAAVPVVASAIMATISLTSLDALCKVCAGIYLSSALSLIAAVVWWRSTPAQAAEQPAATPRASTRDDAADPAWVGGARAARPATDPPAPAPRRVGSAASPRMLALAAVVFGVFHAVPGLAYLAMAPDHSRFIGECGALPDPNRSAPFVDLGRSAGGAEALEILDPLCPACRGFEQRLKETGLLGELDRRALLFPLDDSCNWMVQGSIHPGACAISEAVLCAGERAEDVVAWAFENQEAIRRAAAADPSAAAEMARQTFPELSTCMGSADARARLGQSLRWAVANQLPVLTPQLYVGGAKLCDEDVDLGLEYALSRLIEAHRSGALPKPTPAAPAPPSPNDSGEVNTAAEPSRPRLRETAGSAPEPSAVEPSRTEPADAPGPPADRPPDGPKDEADALEPDPSEDDPAPPDPAPAPEGSDDPMPAQEDNP